MTHTEPLHQTRPAIPAQVTPETATDADGFPTRTWLTPCGEGDMHALAYDLHVAGCRTCPTVLADSYDDRREDYLRDEAGHIHLHTIYGAVGIAVAFLGVYCLLVGAADKIAEWAAAVPAVPQSIAFLLIGAGILAVLLFHRHPALRDDRSPYAGARPGPRIPTQRDGGNN